MLCMGYVITYTGHPILWCDKLHIYFLKYKIGVLYCIETGDVQHNTFNGADEGNIIYLQYSTSLARSCL